ncbi:MAG: hypothetical protein FK734_01195 [Asgard group archaeon]|nr:hypothetical protein [Asgard group archaeon]
MVKSNYKFGLVDFIFGFLVAILAVTVITLWDPQSKIILALTIIVVLLAAFWMAYFAIQMGKTEAPARTNRTRTETNRDSTHDTLTVDSYNFNSSNETSIQESDLTDTIGLQFDIRTQSSENSYEQRISSVILKNLIEVTEKPKSAKCSICKLGFDSNDEIVQCPVCKHFFHKNHINDWLSEHSNCPICDSRLVSHGFKE